MEEEIFCPQCNSLLQTFNEQEIVFENENGEKIKSKVGIWLNTKVTLELYLEMIQNELKRHIQNKRKELNYDIADRIIICTKLANLINFDHIRKDILCNAVVHDLHDGCDEYFDFMGSKIGITKYPKITKK